MITMEQIARKVGVSQPTVSFVLNGRQGAIRISKETQRKVRAAAQELGYRPNEIARAMVTGKTRVVGFLADVLDLEFVGLMSDGASEIAERNRYFIQLLRVEGSQNARQTAQRCAEYRLAGVICRALKEETVDPLHEELSRYQIPMVLVDSSFPHPWGIRVISDDRQGCRLAVEHLAGLGHRRIALIAGYPRTGSAVLRREGYLTAMRKLGLPVPDEFLLWGNYDPVETERVSRKLLAKDGSRPTAIFCDSDLMAMVVMRTARQLGLRVPQDLSVVGFADLRAAEVADPPLTTVAQPFREMGQVAMRHLLASIEAKPKPAKAKPLEEALPTRLVIRKSTAPCAVTQ